MNADLRGTNLNGANLKNANLMGATLQEGNYKNLKNCPKHLPSGWVCENKSLIKL